MFKEEYQSFLNMFLSFEWFGYFKLKCVFAL